jgi:outer membrane protein TolC
MLQLNTILNYGQNVDGCLKSIRENNTDIQKNHKRVDYIDHLLKSQNRPPEPKAEMGLFPSANAPDKLKKAYRFHQTFEFPSVYIQRSKLNNETLLEVKYDSQKEIQDILLESKLSLYELIYIDQRLSTVRKRLSNNRVILSSYKKRLNSGDATLLEINKVKFQMLELKDQLIDAEIKKSAIYTRLKQLNGGYELDTSGLEYKAYTLQIMDSVIAEHSQKNPSILSVMQQVHTARQAYKVAKNELLPELSFGYEQEITPLENFRGPSVGISIPLWGEKQKLQAAKAMNEHTQLTVQSEKEKFESSIANQYNLVTGLDRLLRDYSKTLDETTNIKLLKRSLDLGEISIIEYYRELDYYYNFVNRKLEIENEYYSELARLFPFK